MNVEAGKRFAVAARVNEGRPSEGEVVVYKVDNIRDYRRTGSLRKAAE